MRSTRTLSIGPDKTLEDYIDCSSAVARFLEPLIASLGKLYHPPLPFQVGVCIELIGKLLGYCNG
jgi:hypothetical protein